MEQKGILVPGENFWYTNHDDSVLMKRSTFYGALLSDHPGEENRDSPHEANKMSHMLKNFFSKAQYYIDEKKDTESKSVGRF